MRKRKRAKEQQERPIELHWVTLAGKEQHFSSTDDAEITVLSNVLFLRYITGKIRELHILH